VPRDSRVLNGGTGVEGQNEFAERGENLIRCRVQAIPAAPAGKAFQAIADFGDRDRRRADRGAR
jgi:hypothetical protein